MPTTIHPGLRRCAIALPVIGALAMATSAASAETYSYSGYSMTYSPQETVGIDSSSRGYYIGEITLHGTPNLTVFCMDIYDDLLSADTMNVVTLTGSGSGGSNPNLSPTVLSQIGKLVTNSSTIIHSTGSSLGEASAALQLAIWTLEYGNTHTFYVDSDVSALAADYITTYAGPGSPSFAISLLQTSDPSKPNQDLVFIAACGDGGGPGCSAPTVAPLPGALPLLASGLGAFGILGWRRKRKKAALAA